MTTKVNTGMTSFPGELAPIGSVLAYLGSTPPATRTAATATLTFGDTEFDDVNNGTLTLVSAGGLSRVYTIRNDYGASTNIEFNAGASASTAAANLKAAIEHADGHNGQLTVSQTDGQLLITQATAGIEGNTTITTGASFDNACDVNIGAKFTGGLSHGWLVCDGSVISRTDYSALFDQIGTTYGAGDGSTTFAIPDLRGRVLIGNDSMGTPPMASRVLSSPDGIDGGTLGAAGSRLIETDAGKSQGFVCNWIIRASEDDS